MTVYPECPLCRDAMGTPRRACLGPFEEGRRAGRKSFLGWEIGDAGPRADTGAAATNQLQEAI